VLNKINKYQVSEEEEKEKNKKSKTIVVKAQKKKKKLCKSCKDDIKVDLNKSTNNNDYCRT
jgi:predicted transcriptional regulator